MQRELEASPAIVSECAVKLLLVVGFAWSGTSPVDLTAPESAGGSPPRQFQPEPESKAAFDERRKRYIEANPDSHVAREDRLQQLKDAHAWRAISRFQENENFACVRSYQPLERK